MKHFLTTLLLATLCATGLGQTIKSLGYNTTNGMVVYKNTNQLTYTNSLAFDSISSHGSPIGRPYLLSMQEINALLVGKTTNQMPLYSTLDHTNTNYVRNTNVWAHPIDLTGVAAYRSGGGTASIGTAITPIHIVYAHHAPLTNGTTFRFVDLDNNVFVRTLTNSERVPQNEVDFTDIRIGVLNEPLPKSIRPLPLVSPEAIVNARNENAEYINAFINQNQKLVVSKTTAGGAASVSAPTNLPNSNFWIAVTNGDSGFPIFLIANGQAHLTAVFASSSGGEFIGARRTQIEAVMSNLNASYSLAPYYGQFVSRSLFMQVELGNSLATINNGYVAQPAREALALRSEGFESVLLDATDSNDQNELVFTNIEVATFAGNTASVFRQGLGIPLPALTNTSNVTMMRALAGSTNTNEPFSGTLYLLDLNSDEIQITVSNGIILNAVNP